MSEVRYNGMLDLEKKHITVAKELAAHAEEIRHRSLAQLFKEASSNSHQAEIHVAGLSLDLRRHFLTDKTRQLLYALATSAQLNERISNLHQGKPINDFHQTRALHTLLRNITTQRYSHLSVYSKQIEDCFVKMMHFTKAVHEGVYRSFQHNKFTDIVHIGIGGSHLGTQLAVEALKPFHLSHCRSHFISSIDQGMSDLVLSSLDPTSTLFIIVSKMFTTEETCFNAEKARAWLLQNCMPQEEWRKHFIAVTTDQAAANAWGILPENIYPLWDWVAGRFSVWSAVGLSIALTVGTENFKVFLAGAAAMDEHFFHTDFLNNAPVMLGLMGIWYRNFFHTNSHAILPYAYQLRNFAAYLQQLEMESNGKSIDIDDKPVTHKTVPVIFGGCGTETQHSFHQFLHQGTDFIPVDFIVAHLSDYDQIAQQRLIAHCYAQADVLMQGHQAATPYQTLSGNKPSTIISMDRITPFTLGALLALYEHKVFVQGIVWHVNSFDQWGVEYGKVRAQSFCS